ncbi:hypothetical protein R1sor_017377 [Riccia sorocarpa]|uniref:Uncharacterized protein n=1 Tax=Riccia sorocarpa TaxID=122646 RepID=A0ABD3IA98_9MARC
MVPPNWLDGMIKWVPEKVDKEMPANEASSSDLEDDDGNRRKRKSKKKMYVVEPLPSQVVTALHRVYQAKRVAKHFTVVVVMEFGQTPVDFTSALKEMNDARVSFEYGCYEGPRVNRISAMSYPCWQMMYVFVSLDAEDYKPVLVDDITKRPFLIEYEPDSWVYEKDVTE